MPFETPVIINVLSSVGLTASEIAPQSSLGSTSFRKTCGWVVQSRCKAFRGEAGIYTILRVGMEFALEDRVSFSPIIAGSAHREYVVAGIFIFGGFQFLIYLEPDGPQDLTGMYFKGEHLAEANLIFQTLTANINIGRHPSHVVEIVRKQ